jgi:hypothetical protein
VKEGSANMEEVISTLMPGNADSDISKKEVAGRRSRRPVKTTAEDEGG